MQNLMFKCSELASNLKKQKHYLMVKTAKNYFRRFYCCKCVCATVIKQLLKSLIRYGKYNKNLNGYHLFIINITSPNPEQNFQIWSRQITPNVYSLELFLVTFCK